MVYKKTIKDIAKRYKKRLSKKAMDKLDKILNEKARDILDKARRNADFAGRSTIQKEDILNTD